MKLDMSIGTQLFCRSLDERSQTRMPAEAHKQQVKGVARTK